MELPGDKVKDALRCIAAWQADPAASCTCPVCGASGMAIVDRSVRPYSEWYVLNCSSCGLNATLHVPMPGPSGFG